MVERPDGTQVREHLDVGENPPIGAIVYYWLAQEAKDGVTLTFRDFGRPQDRDPVEHREGRPAGAQARHQGRPQPVRLGHALSRARARSTTRWRRRGPSRWCPIPRTRPARPWCPAPTASTSRSTARPSRPSSPWSRTRACRRRRSSTPSSSPCTRQLVASLSKLKEALNRLRRMKRRLGEVAELAPQVRARLAQPGQGGRCRSSTRSRR